MFQNSKVNTFEGLTTLPKSFPWKYFFERLKKFIQRTFLENGLEFWENWALFTAGAFSGAYHLKHLRKEILECSYRLIKNGSEDHRKVFFRLYHVNLRVNQSAKGPKISPYSWIANAVKNQSKRISSIYHKIKTLSLFLNRSGSKFWEKTKTNEFRQTIFWLKSC